MMFLAAFNDSLGFAVLLLATVSVPTVGLILSGVALAKRSHNFWIAVATFIFFLALFTISLSSALGRWGGIAEATVLWILLICCGAHAFSALLSLVGTIRARRRRRASHGSRRGIWVFWLNWAAIVLVGIWCFAHVNQRAFDQFLK